MSGFPDPTPGTRVPRAPATIRRWVTFTLLAAAVITAIAYAPVALDAYDAHRERKALANRMAKQFLDFCTTVEEVLGKMGARSST